MAKLTFVLFSLLAMALVSSTVSKNIGDKDNTSSPTVATEQTTSEDVTRVETTETTSEDSTTEDIETTTTEDNETTTEDSEATESTSEEGTDGTEEPTEPNTPAPVICKPGDIATVEIEGICDKYVVCLLGDAIEIECPKGLFISILQHACVPPENSECCQRNTCEIEE